MAKKTQKTHKGTKKVLNVRQSGSITVGHPGSRHNTGSKTSAFNRTKRAKSDATIKGLKGNEQLGDKIIRDTYKTLLSRGQKGCFIYCEDEKLGKYIKEALQKAKRSC